MFMLDCWTMSCTVLVMASCVSGVSVNVLLRLCMCR